MNNSLSNKELFYKLLKMYKRAVKEQNKLLLKKDELSTQLLSITSPNNPNKIKGTSPKTNIPYELYDKFDDISDILDLHQDYICTFEKGLQNVNDGINLPYFQMYYLLDVSISSLATNSNTTKSYLSKAFDDIIDDFVKNNRSALVGTYNKLLNYYKR